MCPDHEKTEVVAVRMVEEFDAGPVYLRRPISLLGGGDEIYMRIARDLLPGRDRWHRGGETDTRACRGRLRCAG